MRRPPLILITPRTERRGKQFFGYSVVLSDGYSRSISEAGGVPWILSATPSTEDLAEIVRRCDGVLFSGGEDIEPRLYCDAVPPELEKTVVVADPIRDWVELRVVEEVFRQRKPVLAICRGMQLLNVAFGGTLIVDLDRQAPGNIRHHRTDRKDSLVHEVHLKANSRLTGIFGTEMIRVNSTHHQAVARMAKLFRTTGSSPDGIAEAMELSLSDRNLLPYLMGVQFHPERLILRSPEFLEIFRDFVRACRARPVDSVARRASPKHQP